MKRAGADTGPSLTANPVVPLKTTPVGPPATVTTRESFLPVPSYSVLVSVASLAIHQGPVWLAARPQALTRFESTVAPARGPSETRPRTTNAFSPSAVGVDEAGAAVPRTTASAIADSRRQLFVTTSRIVPR